MKILPTIFIHQLRGRAAQRNLKTLGQFLLALAALVVIYTVLFYFLMAWEGQRFSWLTGVYWTLTVMSTLGFGDITFQSDLGRAFSIVVLLSGTLFMLILLPFTFIQFFYAPWMESQAASLAPRELRLGVTGHVVLLNYGPVEVALIRQLARRWWTEPCAIFACPSMPRSTSSAFGNEGRSVLQGPILEFFFQHRPFAGWHASAAR